jgi:hypothetical protein
MTQRRNDYAVQDQAEKSRQETAVKTIQQSGHHGSVRWDESPAAGNERWLPTQEANAWLLDRLHRIEVLVERIWERIK